MHCDACAAGKKGVANSVGLVRSSVSASCVDCVAGFFTESDGRSDGAGCSACPSGWFQDASGQSACKVCAVGQVQSLNGQTGCIACAVNHYMSERGSRLPSCIPCPAGYMGLVDPTAARSSCNACGEGKFQEDMAKASCRDCPTGFYSSTILRIGCEACGAGKFGNGDDSARSSEGIHCQNCVAGKFTSTVGVPEICKDCPAGYIVENDSVNTQCLKCAIGKFQDEMGKDLCDYCPNGYFIGVTGSISCEACSAGKLGVSSVAQRTEESNSCQQCESGKYSHTVGTRSDQGCSSCPAGYKEIETHSRCDACQAGRFLDSIEGLICKFCPYGFWQDEIGMEKCKACASGRYGPLSTGSVSSCTGCAGGRYLPEEAKYSSQSGVDVCALCPEGYFSVGGQSSCTPCRYVETYKTDTIVVNVTSYQDEVGQITCKPCRVWDTSVSSSQPCLSSSQTKDPANCIGAIRGYCNDQDANVYFYMCTGSFVVSGDGATCTSCDGGGGNRRRLSILSRYLVGTGRKDERDCVVCPSGSGLSRGTEDTCTICAKGTYMNREDHREACRACPVGYFQPSTEQASCIACPNGWYTTRPSQAKCVGCGIGKAAKSSSLTASIAEEDACESCTSGKYQDSTGSSNCIDCEKGRFHNETGLSYCNDCIPGRFANETGSIECLPCSLGYFAAVSVAAECSKCPVGFSQSAVGQAYCSACTAGQFTSRSALGSCNFCTVGKFQIANEAVDCSSCPLGYFSSKTSSTFCSSCPNGYYNAGNAQNASCTACPVGRLGAATSAPSLTAGCAVCPSGQYTDEVGLSSCKPCGTGRFIDDETNAIKHDNKADCKICPGGWFQASNTGAATCEQCGKARFLNGLLASDHDSVQDCKACPEGYYGADIGQSDCIMCIEGEYASTGSTVCTDCEVGRYQENKMSSSCVLCPIGYIINTEKSVNCTPCEPGYIAKRFGGQVCEKCQKGKISPNLAGTECASCNPGYFASDDGSRQCDSCDSGFYASSFASTSCTACLPGTYQQSSSQTKCENCPEGYFSPDLNFSQCKHCPSGWVQIQSKQKVCTDCPEGTYAAVVSATTCIDCPLGYVAPNRAMSECLLCTERKYAPSERLSSCSRCEEGYAHTNSSCNLCPAGYFNSAGSLDTPENVGTGICSSCPVGYMAPEKSGNCSKCGVNGQEPTIDQSSCEFCKPGKFRNISLTSDTGVCNLCLTGQIAVTPGSPFCSNCPKGTIFVKSSLPCKSVDVSWYSFTIRFQLAEGFEQPTEETMKELKRSILSASSRAIDCDTITPTNAPDLEALSDDGKLPSDYFDIGLILFRGPWNPTSDYDKTFQAEIRFEFQTGDAQRAVVSGVTPETVNNYLKYSGCNHEDAQSLHAAQVTHFCAACQENAWNTPSDQSWLHRLGSVTSWSEEEERNCTTSSASSSWSYFPRLGPFRYYETCQSTNFDGSLNGSSVVSIGLTRAFYPSGTTSNPYCILTFDGSCPIDYDELDDNSDEILNEVVDIGRLAIPSPATTFWQVKSEYKTAELRSVMYIEDGYTYGTRLQFTPHAYAIAYEITLFDKNEPSLPIQTYCVGVTSCVNVVCMAPFPQSNAKDPNNEFGYGRASELIVSRGICVGSCNMSAMNTSSIQNGTHEKDVSTFNSTCDVSGERVTNETVDENGIRICPHCTGSEIQLSFMSNRFRVDLPKPTERWMQANILLGHTYYANVQSMDSKEYCKDVLTCTAEMIGSVSTSARECNPIQVVVNSTYKNGVIVHYGDAPKTSDVDGSCYQTLFAKRPRRMTNLQIFRRRGEFKDISISFDFFKFHTNVEPLDIILIWEDVEDVQITKDKTTPRRVFTLARGEQAGNCKNASLCYQGRRLFYTLVPERNLVCLNSGNSQVLRSCGFTVTGNWWENDPIEVGFIPDNGTQTIGNLNARTYGYRLTGSKNDIYLNDYTNQNLITGDESDGLNFATELEEIAYLLSREKNNFYVPRTPVQFHAYIRNYCNFPGNDKSKEICHSIRSLTSKPVIENCSRNYFFDSDGDKVCFLCPEGAWCGAAEESQIIALDSWARVYGVGTDVAIFAECSSSYIFTRPRRCNGIGSDANSKTWAKTLNSSAKALYDCNGTNVDPRCYCTHADDKIQGCQKGIRSLDGDREYPADEFKPWDACTDSNGFIGLREKCIVEDIEYCQEGYTGFMCSQCVDQSYDLESMMNPSGPRYFRNGNSCAKCVEFSALIVFIVTTTLSITAFLSFLINQKIAGTIAAEKAEQLLIQKGWTEGNADTTEAEEALERNLEIKRTKSAVLVLGKILLTHMQFLGIVSDFPLDFPDWLMDFFDTITGLFGGDVARLGPGCFMYVQPEPHKLTGISRLLASKHYIVTSFKMSLPFIALIFVWATWTCVLSTKRIRKGRDLTGLITGLIMFLWSYILRQIICCKCFLRGSQYACRCKRLPFSFCKSFRDTCDKALEARNKERLKDETRLRSDMKERLRHRMLWQKRLKSINPNLDRAKRNKKQNKLKERLLKQERAYPEDKLCCDARQPDCCSCLCITFKRKDAFASMDIDDEGHFRRPWYLLFNRIDSNLCCQRTLLSMVVIFFMLISSLVKDVMSINSCAAVNAKVADGVFNVSRHVPEMKRMGWSLKESHPANFATDTAAYTRFETKRLIDDPGQVCYDSDLTGATMEASRPHQEALQRIFYPFLSLYVIIVPLLMIEATRRFKGRQYPWTAPLRRIWGKFFMRCKIYICDPIFRMSEPACPKLACCSDQRHGLYPCCGGIFRECCCCSGRQDVQCCKCTTNLKGKPNCLARWFGDKRNYEYQGKTELQIKKIKKEMRRTEKKFWSAFEFLTDGYKDEYFFWESVVMFRKIVMTMLWTATLSSSDPYIGLMGAFFFVLVNYGISTALCPFETLAVNYVEQHGLLTISLTFFLGLLMDNPSSVIRTCPAGTLQAGSVGLNSCPATFACYLNSGAKFNEAYRPFPEIESQKFSEETRWYRNSDSAEVRQRCFRNDPDEGFCQAFQSDCGMDNVERFVSFGSKLDIAGNPVCKCSPQIEVGEKWGRNFKQIGNAMATVIVVINLLWMARFVSLLLTLSKNAYWEGIKRGCCGKLCQCFSNLTETSSQHGKNTKQGSDFSQDLVDDWMEVQGDDGRIVLFNPFLE